MGLSSEERFKKFFGCMEIWRRELVELEGEVGKIQNWSRQPGAEAVRGWIRKLDTMTGIAHRHTASSTAYWLIGETEGSLRSLLADPYVAHQQDVEDLPSSTVRWWEKTANTAFTASRLQFPPLKSHCGLNALGKWWDCYEYMSAVAYPIYRYEDQLFPEDLKQVFTELCGEMINRRLEICFGDRCDLEEAEQTEQHLLLKHDAFHGLLTQETREFKGDDYFNKEFDGYGLYKRVAEMSAADLRALAERMSKERHERARMIEVKEPSDTPDGLFGSVPAKPEPNHSTAEVK